MFLFDLFQNRLKKAWNEDEDEENLNARIQNAKIEIKVDLDMESDVAESSRSKTSAAGVHQMRRLHRAHYTIV